MKKVMHSILGVICTLSISMSTAQAAEPITSDDTHAQVCEASDDGMLVPESGDESMELACNQTKFLQCLAACPKGNMHVYLICIDKCDALWGC